MTRMRRAFAITPRVLAGLLGVALLATSRPAAGAPPFQVHASLAGLETAVAGGNAGRFMVVWRTPDAASVVGRWIAGGVPQGPEVVVNVSSGTHVVPDVAWGGLAGRWTVVWEGLTGIYVQDILSTAYDDTGAIVTPEHFVNDTRGFSQLRPAVAAGGLLGDFVVWEESSTNPRSLRGKWSSLPTSEFQISGAEGFDPAVSVANAGFGVATVAWGTGTATGIVGRQFIGTSPSSAVFQVSPGALLAWADVAAAPSGAFTVTWTEFAGPSDNEIMARSYDSNANPLGPPFQVNGTTANQQLRSAVATDAAGNVMVVWEDVTTRQIRARRYTSASVAWAPEIRVAFPPDLDTHLRRPDVAADAAGNFLVVWDQQLVAPGAPYAVVARQYLPCTPAADPDADGLCGADDNCPTTPNPDQNDLDGTGGGDLCDPCPGSADTLCDPSRSRAATIGTAGGTLTAGLVTLTVPPGVAGGDVSFSITGGLATSEYGLGNSGLSGTPVLDVVKLGPEGAPLYFEPRVVATLGWADVLPPLGTEDTKGIAESNLRIYRNGSALTLRCGAPECALPGCATGTTCGVNAYAGVAGLCCDPNANTWTLPLRTFSELVLAEDPCAEERICDPTFPDVGGLKLVDAPNDAKDKLLWKMTAAGMVSAFGDPMAENGTSYALCFYDATVSPARTIGRVVIPAGGLCNGTPCWKPAGALGFKYKRKDGVPEGATTLVVKDGPYLHVTLKGKGALLANRVAPLPAPPLGSPPLPVLRVQLRARDAACWEAEYAAAKVDRPGLFVAKPVVVSHY